MARSPERAPVLVCVSLAREDQLQRVAYLLYVRGSLRWAGVVRQLPRPSRSAGEIIENVGFMLHGGDHLLVPGPGGVRADDGQGGKVGGQGVQVDRTGVV